MEILERNSIPTLKKICKILHIENYSRLKKTDIIDVINKHHSILKIQRWYRNKKIEHKLCSISYEKIEYPFFAYKSNGVIIYYNIESIRNFLIKTGDFRDPNTRTEYTEKNIYDIDKIFEVYKKKNKEYIEEKNIFFTSVTKAYKNERFYKRLKEKEQEIFIFERVLDNICEGIKKTIDQNVERMLYQIKTMYLFDYEVYFKRLVITSSDNAKYSIDKNIKHMTQIYEKENYTIFQKEVCEYVIVFLFQLQEDI